MSTPGLLPPDLTDAAAALASLPERRRARVLDVLARERAAERIPAVYARHLARWREAEAFARTAETLRAEGAAFVTARWVQRVVREGR